MTPVRKSHVVPVSSPTPSNVTPYSGGTTVIVVVVVSEAAFVLSPCEVAVTMILYSPGCVRRSPAAVNITFADSPAASIISI